MVIQISWVKLLALLKICEEMKYLVLQLVFAEEILACLDHPSHLKEADCHDAIKQLKTDGGCCALTLSTSSHLDSVLLILEEVQT